jgi:hypothetical protein
LFQSDHGNLVVWFDFEDLAVLAGGLGG